MHFRARQEPAEVYAHKLDLAAAADAAGFHGMFLAEHQGNLTRKAGRPEVHKTTPYDEDSWQRLIVGSGIDATRTG